MLPAGWMGAGMCGEGAGRMSAVGEVEIPERCPIVKEKRPSSKGEPFALLSAHSNPAGARMRRLALFAALLLAPLMARAQPVLNVYNWTDYIDPYVV